MRNFSASEEDGAFPVLSSRSPSPSASPRKPSSKRKSASKKLASAYNALKCSSRADEDNHHFPPGYRSDGTFPSTSELPPSVEEQEWHASFGSDTGNDERRSSPVDLDDEIEETTTPDKDATQQDSSISPFRALSTQVKEHTNETSGDIQSPLPSVPPERIASEDTHDTPQVSNVDPNKTPQNIMLKANLSLDDFCHKYFQPNPPRQIPVFHSAGSLGDCITPLDSPVVDDDKDHGDSDEAPTVDMEEAKRVLQLPSSSLPSGDVTTITSVTSTSSYAESDAHRLATESVDSSSMLFGEHISIAASSPASQNREEIRYPIETPSILTTVPLPPVPKVKTISSRAGNTSDSSFSSVSSFLEVPLQDPKPNKSEFKNYRIDGDKKNKTSAVTPRPFFWRSHPNVTIRSYDFQKQQRQCKPQIRTVTPKIQSVGVMDSFSDFQSSTGTSPQGSPENDTANPRSNKPRRSSSFAPYIHPAMVRKMWHDSQPFQLKINSNWQHLRKDSERHPQGPPSTRSNQNPIVQSLVSFAKIPAAFARPENNARGRGRVSSTSTSRKSSSSLHFV